MKQTAVEFLFSELERMQYFIGNDIYQAYKEALQKEKEQIIESWANKRYIDYPYPTKEAEEYYNETYNKESKQ